MPFDPSVLFGGLKIVKSPTAVSKQRNKAHKLNPKRKNSYHLRIQKKWDKKFGSEYKPGMFLLGFDLAVHPEVFDKLMHEVKKAGDLNVLLSNTVIPTPQN